MIYVIPDERSEDPEPVSAHADGRTATNDFDGGTPVPGSPSAPRNDGGAISRVSASR